MPPGSLLPFLPLRRLRPCRVPGRRAAFRRLCGALGLAGLCGLSCAAGQADAAKLPALLPGAAGAGSGSGAAPGPAPSSSAGPSANAPAPPSPAQATAPAQAASSPPGPDCTRPLTLGLHEHGLLYSSQTGEGIDKDIADELVRRSGCRIQLLVLPRARIWQLLESGTLDFSLSAIGDDVRDRFASFAWYVSNKYYLLVRRDAHVGTVNDFRHHPALKLGVIRGFRYSPNANLFVDRLDDDQRVTYASGLDPLYEILLENHIQGMIIEPFDYPAIEGVRLREATLVLEFDDPAVPHGLVMSRKSLSNAQQQAWREVIAGMRADGTTRRIFEKYFPPDLARAMTQF